jgi:hypothetical protein
MATKKQIAEQAIRILSGGHLKPDRTIDIREVMLNLDQIRDARVRLDVLNSVKDGSYTVDSDYLSFYSPVLVDTTTEGVRSCTMPASTVSLYGGLEIYQVTPVNDLESPFIILQPGEVGMMSGSSALEHEDKVFCYKIGEQMFFKNLDALVLSVSMLIAVSGKEIAEDDEYPVPPDVEDDLLKQLIQMFGIQVQVPHDELEDGNK